MGSVFANLLTDYMFHRIEDITPEFLRELGVRGLIIDIDNTLMRWEEYEAPPSVREWLRAASDAGFKIVLLSNGLRSKQARVAGDLDLQVVAGWLPKPLPSGFRSAMRVLGLPPTQVASIGDIVFTDIWGANRLGIITILVEPRSSRDFLGTRIWRLLERLFRLRRAKKTDPK